MLLPRDGTTISQLQKHAAHLHKVGVLGVPDGDHRVHLLDQLLLLIVVKLHVPFGQPCLASSVLNQNESDLLQQQKLKRMTMLTHWVGKRVKKDT